MNKPKIYEYTSKRLNINNEQYDYESKLSGSRMQILLKIEDKIFASEYVFENGRKDLTIVNVWGMYEEYSGCDISREILEIFFSLEGYSLAQLKKEKYIDKKQYDYFIEEEQVKKVNIGMAGLYKEALYSEGKKEDEQSK